MKNDNISKRILLKMQEEPENTIFTISDFYDLGSRSAIKTALFRLTKEGTLHRLIDGFYVIPYYSKLINEYGNPSIDQLAMKIAEKYAWNISPYGENALNQVGLSTQIPTVYEYLSDGPYRQFCYSNNIIKFKHTSNRVVSKFSLPLSLVIQSIKALGKERITIKEIKRMSYFSEKYVQEDLLQDAKAVPAWIYSILKEIDKDMKNEK
ncbi:MAG: DUF6088 family protein [Erysipelotrichaceae bacterium]